MRQVPPRFTFASQRQRPRLWVLVALAVLIPWVLGVVMILLQALSLLSALLELALGLLLSLIAQVLPALLDPGVLITALVIGCLLWQEAREDEPPGAGYR